MEKQKAMTTTKSKNQDHEKQQALDEAVTKIIEVIEVERMYLNKGTCQQPFTYRLQIITKLSQSKQTDAIRPVIDDILLEITDLSYQVFSFSYAQSELQQGNLYFLNHCHHSHLIYKTPEGTLVWHYPNHDTTAIEEKIKQDFKRDMFKISSFKKGMNYFK